MRVLKRGAAAPTGRLSSGRCCSRRTPVSASEASRPSAEIRRSSSSAISSEASRDHRSTGLKATTRSGCSYWPVRRSSTTEQASVSAFAMRAMSASDNSCRCSGSRNRSHQLARNVAAWPSRRQPLSGAMGRRERACHLPLADRMADWHRLSVARLPAFEPHGS
jgi:hypothetical protein